MPVDEIPIEAVPDIASVAAGIVAHLQEVIITSNG